MRAAKISLLILTLICLVIFQIINRMTVDPTTSSGNGNPALFISVVLVPIFIFMVLLWVRVLRVHLVQVRFSIIGLLVILTHLIISFVYQRNALLNYREFVKNELIKKNGSVDIQYVESITSVFGIHVNNQYFNLNTFFMFITFSIFISIAYYLWDLFEEKNEGKNNQT